ncbi:two-component sensor histidine kinase [Bacillus freudenreichii]|nr:two-component sensor histidine kinase [Bacillus freudenreichii]
MVANEYRNKEDEINSAPGDNNFAIDLTEQTGDLVGLFDVAHREILYLSSSFPTYLGLSVEAVHKNPSIIRKKLYPEDADKLFQMFVSASMFPSEFEYRVKGEIDRWFRTTIIPIINSDGIVTKKISFTRDVSYWKKKNLFESNSIQMDLLGEIAAAFAHEIRNPLTTIKGFLQLMGQDKANPYEQIILQETEKIESIISEFLMLAQPYPKFDFAMVDINEIVNDIFDTISQEAAQNKIEIFITLGMTIPPVFGSPVQIRQALLNLVKNAVQSMPSSGGKIYISVASVAGFVSIKIKDGGKGISPEKLDRLGIPNYSNKENGAGLGIMISRQIIKNHQGSIRFTSEIGKGTTVEVLLPSADVSANYDEL